MRAARGDVEGRRYNSNNDVVIYEGVSKYYPADRGTISPALFHGAFEYNVVLDDIPPPSTTSPSSTLVDGQVLIGGSSVVGTFATLNEEDAAFPGGALTYAGSMFDIKGRSDIEITSIGFSTRLNTTLGILLYVKEGGYASYEDDIAQW